MKHKKVTIGLIGIALVISMTAVSFFIFNPNASAPTVTKEDGLVAPPDAPVATNRVTIQNFHLSTPAIVIQKGDTVIWTNADSTTQQITFYYPDRKDSSGVLNQNASYSRSFDYVGTILYNLSGNPNEVGSITIRP